MLAKCVKGLYDETWVELRRVTLGGAALAIEANKAMKIKSLAPASIVFPYFEVWVPRISSNVEKCYSDIVIYGLKNHSATAVIITRKPIFAFSLRAGIRRAES